MAERKISGKIHKAELKKRIESLNVWARGDERAPHKPLLILLSLARVAQGQERLTPFTELAGPLRSLLLNFGPPRKSVHPEYPFWRLQNDGLWEVPGDSSMLTRRKRNEDVLKSELIKHQVQGGFPESIHELFRKDRRFLDAVAMLILDAHFPSSLHQDILDEVGLSLAQGSTSGPRDPAFRETVIQAYERRCAICGYDAKMDYSDLGLEAAHIKWVQAGGPDELRNGLALCTIHHRAFDRGAIGLADDLSVMVSVALHGQSWVVEWFHAFRGKRIREPYSSKVLPRQEYLAWHRKQVFRAPARD